MLKELWKSALTNQLAVLKKAEPGNVKLQRALEADMLVVDRLDADAADAEFKRLRPAKRQAAAPAAAGAGAGAGAGDDDE